jgi:hypothetical protein
VIDGLVVRDWPLARDALDEGAPLCSFRAQRLDAAQTSQE